MVGGRAVPDNKGHKWWLSRQWLIAVVAVLVVVGTGLGLWATRASAVGGYTLGTATTASVSKTLEVSGTASPVHQATAEFQVAGTVSTVDVTLNSRSPLDKLLRRSNRHRCRRTSQPHKRPCRRPKRSYSKTAEPSPSSSATTSSTGSSASASSSSTSHPTTTTTTTPRRPRAPRSRQAPRLRHGPGRHYNEPCTSSTGRGVAQQSADSDSAAADAALQKAQDACSSSSTAPATSPTTTSTTKASSTKSSSKTTSTSPTRTACIDDLAQELSAEKKVQQDDTAVAKAETALAKVLGASSSSSGSSTGTGKRAISGSGSPAPTSAGSTTSASGAPISSGTTSSGSSPTDRARVDLAPPRQPPAREPTRHRPRRLPRAAPRHPQAVPRHMVVRRRLLTPHSSWRAIKRPSMPTRLHSSRLSRTSRTLNSPVLSAAPSPRSASRLVNR